MIWIVFAMFNLVGVAANASLGNVGWTLINALAFGISFKNAFKNST